MLKAHRFVGHKQEYQSIPLQKRSCFLVNLLKTPQESRQTNIPKQEYLEQSSFLYKQYKLHYYYAETTSEPQAIIIYLHGLNSYGGTSAYMGVSIARAMPQVNVYALDFLNFGKSKGDYKGYIQQFQQLIREAQAFVDYILCNFSKRPKVFLTGASLGGTIAFRMTLLNPEKYAGVIFLSPGLRELKQSQYIMKQIGKLIGYFFPKLKLTAQNDDDSTRYCLKQMIKSNKLNYNGRHIPGSIRVALNAVEQTEKLFSKFNTPYIVFQSGVDKIIDPFAPLDLQKQCQTKDKTTIYMKQMWHSLYYEQQFKDVVNIAIDWLQKRI